METLPLLVLITMMTTFVSYNQGMTLYGVPVPIPATSQVHFKVYNPEDGSYHFGYDTGLMKYQSFREELREPNGKVTGMFGYIDTQGVLRITEYIADRRGYRSKTTTRYLVKKKLPLPIIGPIPPPLIGQHTASFKK